MIGKGPVVHCDAMCAGRHRFHCVHHVVMSFVTADGVVQSVMYLRPGGHNVAVPRDVAVAIDCADDVVWSVGECDRFETLDPVPCEVTLLRPLSQAEEMRQVYREEFLAATLNNMRRKPESFEAANDFEIDGVDPLSPAERDFLDISSDIDALNSPVTILPPAEPFPDPVVEKPKVKRSAKPV